MSKKYNLGIIGCGDFLRWQADAIKGSKNVAVKALFDPMKERAEKIANDLALAEAKNKSAEDLRQQIEERLKNIKLEEQRIISEAQEKARQVAEVKTQEYQAEYTRLRKAKEADLKKIETDFYRSFEEKIGDVLLEACEKVINCDLTPELQQKILTERVQELKKLKGF